MNQSIRIGIGCGGDPDAFASGRAIAQQALSEGRVETPDLVLAFCHGRLDVREFLRGLRSQVGEKVPIIGGSAIGIITRDFLSYKGCPAGAAVLQWDGLCRRTASADRLNRGEFEAGWKLGAQLAGQVEQKLLLMFYDSIRTSPTGSTPPMMNASPPLIRGIEEGLAQPGLPIFGAGVMGGYDFGPTWQFCGGSIGQQSVVGCLLGGRMQFAVQVMHGCEPMDGLRHRITRMSGSIIRELDGRPVVELTGGVPLLGFYSGVEVAPMLGRSRGLDWTGVLLVLMED